MVAAEHGRLAEAKLRRLDTASLKRSGRGRWFSALLPVRIATSLRALTFALLSDRISI